MQKSNVQINLEKVADIRKRNPTAKHVYIRRVGQDGLVIDIPVDHAEVTIRRHPKWEIVSSSKEMDDEVEALFKEPEQAVEELEVPPKPSDKKKRKSDAEVISTVLENQMAMDTIRGSELSPQRTRGKKRGRPKKVRT